MEIPENSQSTVFMFNIENEVDLVKLGELVEQSKKKLADEKQINGVLTLASVSPPNDMDKSRNQYIVMLEPENGGTTFSFFYDMAGNLTSFDY